MIVYSEPRGHYRGYPSGSTEGAMRIASNAALTLALLAGLASPSLAQDSVSTNADGGNGLPGDALDPFTTSFQSLNYVVDLVPLTTSWGTHFAVAPIAKSGRPPGTNRFSSLNGASAISQTVRTGAPYPASSYFLWTSAGAGRGPNNNTAGTSSVATTGTASVFGVGFLDYCDTNVLGIQSFMNQIIGCQVAFDPASPARLFVRRVVAASNSSGQAVQDRSQFGFGAIDASGNVYLRADSTTATSSTNPIACDNYFRVALGSRGATINSIDAAGATDTAASARLLNNGAVTVNTPTCIPADLAGRALLIGSNLAGQLISETSPGTLTNVATHLAGAADQRGAVSVSGASLFAGSVGTGAIIARTTANGRNDSIALFGLSAAGAVVAPRLLTLPSSASDPCSGTAWPNGSPFTSADLRHYDSQVVFRGGNGPVAVAKDQGGRALAAAVAYNDAFEFASDNPYNAILVARFDPSSGSSPVAWSVAAWTSTSTADGKPIYGDFGADGIPNTSDAGEGDGTLDAAPIGRLASTSELSLGKDGPSLSAPMLDSVGNVWFVGSVRLNAMVGGQPGFEFSTALLRGVYDPGAFCYKLELVLKVGDSFLGANSATRYRVAVLGLADVDSIASEAPWSGSMMSAAWNNTSTAGLDPRSPKSLGGLVLSARIVYDRNNDGLYQDPSIAGGATASVDEAYNVALYVGNTDNAQGCPADLDDGSMTGTPDGGVDINDLLFFLAMYEAGDVRADLDDGSMTGTHDGGVDINDLLFFIAHYEAGC